MHRTLVCLALVLGLGSAARADLIGWWTFDAGAGAVAQDSSGSGNHGAFVGSPQWVDGIREGALQFDGSSYVNCGNSTRLQATGPITIACWINPPALSSERGIVGRDGNFAFKASGTTLRFTTPGILDHTGANSTLKAGVWQHVAATFDPGQTNGLTFYINGLQTNRMTASAINAGTGSFRIGNNQWNEYYVGMIDDVRVYNEILPAAEIKKLAFRPKAYAPSPIDGDPAVVQPLLFTWTPGSAAQWHRVYLGTSPVLTQADVIAAQTLFAMYYYAPGLQPGVTYFWRVDEITVDGTVYEGDVWTFAAAPVTAYEPNPRNGDRWVDQHISLAWKAGQGAIEHAVYFGADEAAVANRAAGTFRKTVFTSAYQPGPLGTETTYFWAVDEMTNAGVKHPGEMWHFTTGGGPGGAKGEYFVGMVPKGDPGLTRIDSTIDFTWGTSGGPGEPIGVDQFSARWTADLEIAVTDSYTFITHTDDGARLWLDDHLIIDRWVDQGPTDAFSKPQNLEPGIYPLRMEYYENGGGATAQLFWQTPYIARQILPAGPLQPPLRARAIYPLNGAADVPQDGLLQWSAGDKAQAHDVYFGRDANATTATADIYRGQQALDDTSFSPGELEWNTTYFWRIDEVNPAEAASPWKGPLWSFTTANFLVVDDMETYTDDGGNRIYEFWIDGLTNGSSGSTVGYLQSPFAEQTIVHGGKQSMPMDYNNTQSPFYSEAELEFSPARDWTVNGVDSLTLWFHGAAVRFLETAPDAMTMSSTSGDVWDLRDHMRLVYKRLSGDGSIIARVDSMTNTAVWAKAGVMIRETLEPGSTHALMMLAPDGHTAFQNREFTNDFSESAHSSSGAATFPAWVKLERKGNEFTAYWSADGVTWTLQSNQGGGTSPNPQTIAMADSIYVGLAVTSNNLNTACVARFSGIKTTGNVSGSWEAADIGPAIPGNDPSPLYVTIADSAGKSATVTHPDPTAVTTTAWTEWKVSLSGFTGVNLSKIEKVYVGAGDRQGSQPDGAGRVYIDDIRVTKP